MDELRRTEVSLQDLRTVLRTLLDGHWEMRLWFAGKGLDGVIWCVWRVSKVIGDSPLLLRLMGGSGEMPTESRSYSM